jgi:hypothetical protein
MMEQLIGKYVLMEWENEEGDGLTYIEGEVIDVGPEHFLMRVDSSSLIDGHPSHYHIVSIAAACDEASVFFFDSEAERNVAKNVCKKLAIAA